jgi:hypothetical protein
MFNHQPTTIPIMMARVDQVKAKPASRATLRVGLDLIHSRHRRPSIVA